MYLIDGHIRLLATMRAIGVYGAEIKGVPVQAEGRFKIEADRVLSQIVRKSGKPLTPMECGAVYMKLTAFGWTPEEIASKAGYTPLRVCRLIDLVEHATPRLKALVLSGQAATVVKFHSGDAATLWGVSASTPAQWVDGQGAAGATGLTLHAGAAGGPTASITLAGFSKADLTSGKAIASFGHDTASGSDYLYLHAT